jgi:hypothetical protein
MANTVENTVPTPEPSPDDVRVSRLLLHLRLIGVRLESAADGTLIFTPPLPATEAAACEWLQAHAALALHFQQQLDAITQTVEGKVRELEMALIIYKQPTALDPFKSECLMTASSAAEALAWPFAIYLADRLHATCAAIQQHDATLRTGQYL